MKCLVVDPSPTARRTLVRVLRDAGFEAVITADSPAETRRVLESDDGRAVNLILAEWDLPGETGVDLARGLHREGERTVPPLFLLTSRNTRDEVTRAVEAGVSGYVLKPIDPEVLVARIEAVVGPLRAETGEDAAETSADDDGAEAPVDAAGEPPAEPVEAAGIPAGETAGGTSGDVAGDEAPDEDETETRQAA